MNRHFPIFQSHLDLAHWYWERLLQKGDWVIDATCGNGKDTLKLAKILLEKKGKIIGLDIQSEAISKTKNLLHAQFPHEMSNRIFLYCQSHVQFPFLALENPIRLVVYNLGYLPGGDKLKTTKTQDTLESIEKALELIVPGGAISVMCYPGHEEGREEEQALLSEVSKLTSKSWNVCYHCFPNRFLSPSLILIQKNI